MDPATPRQPRPCMVLVALTMIVDEAFTFPPKIQVRHHVDLEDND